VPGKIGMFKSLLTTRSPLSYINLDAIARKMTFIRRKSKKFSAEGILTTLIKCVIKGKGSFNQIATNLKSSEAKSISRQGVFLRINQKCVDFLRQTTHEILATMAEPVSKICYKYGIKRILTEDSTFQKMNARNSGNFPAHGNKQGATAGFKMDLIYDLLTGLPVFQDLFSGTSQDKTIGKVILNLVKAGDLVLRDMGYFSVSIFHAIDELKAFWLSRLPANVNVEMLDGTRLEKKLRSRSNDMIDEVVFVGNEKLRCRLVAVRAGDELAAERRRSRRNASKNTPSQQSLIRDGWHLLLTNLPESVTKDDLFEIYRLRWNIEVRFKAWKQAIRMKEVFKGGSNYYHYESLIYAALIFQLITLNVASSLKISDRTLSLENFSLAVASILVGVKNISECMSMEFDPRHILMEKRKRKSLMNQLVTTLT
jgi:hypothetical protein